MELVLESKLPDETEALGRAIGASLEPRDVVALIGPLGAGKTRLTRGIAAGAGSTARVTSPTFKLVNEYHGRIILYHIDVYRLNGADDLVALGSDELFDLDGAAVVEWADRVLPALPDDRLTIEIKITGRDTRELVITTSGKRSEALLAKITATFK